MKRGGGVPGDAMTFHKVRRVPSSALLYSSLPFALLLARDSAGLTSF